MNKQDMRFFKAAAQCAEKSDYERVRIGCVAVYKGKIIAEGFNTYKTHPNQKKYDKFRLFHGNARRSHNMHAETNCLNKIDKDDYNTSKIKVYVYRKRKDIPHGVSRPCPACMQQIKDLGIKHIFYSTDSGFAEEYIAT